MKNVQDTEQGLSGAYISSWRRDVAGFRQWSVRRSWVAAEAFSLAVCGELRSLPRWVKVCG